MAKTGRNAPCPCGSGLKYKLCHGAMALVAALPPASARQYAQATGSPFYHQQGGERLGYGNEAFQQDMLDKLQRGEKLW